MLLRIGATFLPQFIMGSEGMPRRYAHYIREWQGYHQASTIGAIIIATGVAMMVGWLAFALQARTAMRE